MFKWRVHPALPPPFHQHTPTPRLPCSPFWYAISSGSVPSSLRTSCVWWAAVVPKIVVVLLPSIRLSVLWIISQLLQKAEGCVLKRPPPPTQTSSRQQCSVLHKKERGNMKTQTASQGIKQQGRRRPKIQINTDARIQSKRHTHTSAIPLQESVLFYYYFLLLNPSVLMIHNAWQRGEGGWWTSSTRTQNTEHRHKRALTETGGDKHKHTHLKPAVTHNGRLV